MAGRSALINVMHKAAIAASKKMLHDFGEVENLQVSRKGAADFVSGADISAARTLHYQLAKARPDWGFIIEDSPNDIDIPPPADADTPCWIIDPIDGTTNFLHGIPHFAISIAAREQGKIMAACIYDPCRHEFYFAEAGKGAFLNDRRIRVSGRRSMADCLFATGSLPLKQYSEDTQLRSLGELHAVMRASSGIRRFGAAALDLAFVAAGRFDGFWQRGLSIWDIAAGILLVREAGGFVSDFSARDKALDSGDIVAANAAIHMPLLEILKPSALNMRK